MNANNYEEALRYILGGGRHTADGLADADVFREAVHYGDWTKVAEGLSVAVERLTEVAQTVEWSQRRRNSTGEHLIESANNRYQFHRLATSGA